MFFRIPGEKSISHNISWKASCRLQRLFRSKVKHNYFTAENIITLSTIAGLADKSNHRRYFSSFVPKKQAPEHNDGATNESQSAPRPNRPKTGAKKSVAKVTEEKKEEVEPEVSQDCEMETELPEDNEEDEEEEDTNDQDLNKVYKMCI